MGSDIRHRVQDAPWPTDREVRLDDPQWAIHRASAVRRQRNPVAQVRGVIHADLADVPQLHRQARGDRLQDADLGDHDFWKGDRLDLQAV